MPQDIDPVMAIVNDERIGLTNLLRSMRVRDDLGLFERCSRRALVAQLARREGLSVRNMRNS